MSQYKPYPKYKPSRVEWIGDVPEGWGVRKIKHVSRIYSGIDRKSDDGCYPLYGANGVIGDCDNFSFLIPRILIGRVGSSGEVNFAKGEYGVSDNCLILDNQTVINTMFLFYMVVSLDLKEGVTKNAQPLITASNIKEKIIPFPCYDEQQKIADFLDKTTERIDALIDKKEKMVKLLKDKRAAIINQVVTKGLDPTVKMKPSGIDWIGDIPEGWKIQRIKFISSVISKGTTPSTIGRELLMDGPVRFIKAENIQGGEIKENPDFFIDEETNKYLKRSELQEGDILFVIAGATIGKTGILEDKFLPANTNQAVSFIRLKREVDNSYVLYWLQSVYIKQITWLDAVQSAQPNLSMESLGNFSIPFSSNKKEQQNIVRYLNQKTGEIDNLIDKTSTAIKKLFECRTAIITAAVTGKIDVREE